jgi:hypothetical protein
MFSVQNTKIVSHDSSTLHPPPSNGIYYYDGWRHNIPVPLGYQLAGGNISSLRGEQIKKTTFIFVLFSFASSPLIINYLVICWNTLHEWT